MKHQFFSLLTFVAIFPFGFLSLPAAGADKPDLKGLIQQYLPACRVRASESGNAQALVSGAGEALDLTKISKENPEPKAAPGYWYSPTMDFLSRQKVQANKAEQATGVIQLLHTLWRGPDFVQKKLYRARSFEGGWVVEVDHDFTNYPGSIQEIMPYELLVDHDHTLTQLRQRCYFYQGSASIYTNTVISVYEREKKIKGGIHYPEALEQELRNAWNKEKDAAIRN